MQCAGVRGRNTPHRSQSSILLSDHQPQVYLAGLDSYNSGVILNTCDTNKPNAWDQTKQITVLGFELTQPL